MRVEIRRLRVYLDTSVVSALFDERSPDALYWTREFWGAIDEYDVFISDVTLAEILETPDVDLRDRMSEAVEGLSVLELNEEAGGLSNEYVRQGAVPERFRRDALHIALASVNEMNILLSWNYRHIVRRKTRTIVRTVNELGGYPFLEILSPPEIAGGQGQ